MNHEVFDDLRGYIDQVKTLGEYKLIEGADYDLEIGAITEWQASVPNSPLLLFDNIKGFESGYRVVSNLFTSEKRVALGLGFPSETRGLELVKAWRDKLKQKVKLIPPVEVETCSIKENIHTDAEVDLFEFPTPKWHEYDGGRYIGTGDMVIIRDPDEGWVNIGTYRVQVHNKNTATIY
ncbi:UbiD family decarboxylase domain-containing protein, partial [Chloroflexota bacterium]